MVDRISDQRKNHLKAIENMTLKDVKERVNLLV